MQVGDKVLYRGEEMTISWVGANLATAMDADERPTTTHQTKFKPVRAPKPPRVPKAKTNAQTITERFNEYHAKNPQVYEKLVELARAVKAQGRKTYGIAPLYEQLRWHFNFNVTLAKGETFKISDNFKSRYARLIMEQEADLKGFFNTKELTSE